MPPRKKATASAAAESSAADDDATGNGIGIDQYELPKSVIARLAKGAVPAEVKLQKEVPLALVKGSTVFINYLAALSHDLATEKNTKTITALHVLEAVKQLGWGDGGASLEKHLKKELKAFRKINEAKKAGTYVAPKKQGPKPVATAKAASRSKKPSTESTPDVDVDVTTDTKTKTKTTKTKGGEEDDGDGEEQLGKTTTTTTGGTSLNDDRPSGEQDEVMNDDEDEEEEEEEEEEEGVEVYEAGEDEDEEDEDDLLSDPAGDDVGVEEPVGAIDKVELDDVEDDDD